ncbi:DUF1146 family protein [Floricoccus penangensis]|uniref:DUF1146 domain-containing protein n=1 Tax=Floricoccus penangensis TaxID=1859475 RepID=A0A9Q5JGI7_9LACT|nr:hypothetical protein BG262_02630 [Floricoccus penangensis]URZ86736.1 DUF1146 family protein [Floricoccus penangensis]
MNIIFEVTRIVSHFIFIYISFNFLSALDFNKIFKANTNYRIIQYFVIFLSVAIGFLVSNFFLEIVSLSKDIFTSFK